MLWSLTKIIIFICVVTALAFGATYVMETDGVVRIAFGTRELSVSPLVAIIALLLFMLAVWLVFKAIGLMLAIFHFFNGDETAISRYFSRNRREKGFQAMADSMMALAAGEGQLAKTKAAKAEKLLNRPELTQLLNAQAAEATGDHSRALAYYKDMLKDDRTRFVGVHGLMKQKLAEGDTDTALKLAEKAFALRPKHEPTLNALFDLQADHEDWSGARKTIAAKVNASTLPRDVGFRREAVLALADARRLLEAGEIEKGKDIALEANRLSPDLIPAAVLAAEMHMLDNSKRAATKALKAAWAATPHPDIAAAFAEIEPDETPEARAKRFKNLVKANATDPESKMLEAELALTQEDFPAARRALGDLAETHPTARSLAIMAAITRGEGAPDKVVRGWLTKALSASRGPQWICDSCGKIHGATWMAKCDNCSGFDTLSWKTPPENDDLSNTPMMLPLVSGMLDDEHYEERDIKVVLDEPTSP